MAQDNVDVVQGAWDAFSRGDIDAVLDVIAPSAETRVPESPSLGRDLRRAGGLRGLRRQAERELRTVHGHARQGPGRRRQPRDRGGEGQGADKGGATIENRAVWVYQLREGRIADAETFGDTAQVLQALG